MKFQTFKAETLVTQTADKAEYQKEITDTDESQFEMIKKLELDRKTHEELIDHCKQIDIQFLSTAFDHDSIDLLDELNIPLFKIPSGEITNLPYLRHIGKMGKPIIMSTGMSTLDEVHNALNILIESGAEKEQITILHCNTEYPTPMKDANLSTIPYLQNMFDVPIGYSDHTDGIDACIAAVAIGADILEKHFTLDKEMEGPDQKLSADPKEFSELADGLRDVASGKKPNGDCYK